MVWGVKTVISGKTGPKVPLNQPCERPPAPLRWCFYSEIADFEHFLASFPAILVQIHALRTSNYGQLNGVVKVLKKSTFQSGNLAQKSPQNWPGMLKIRVFAQNKRHFGPLFGYFGTFSDFVHDSSSIFTKNQVRVRYIPKTWSGYGISLKPGPGMGFLYKTRFWTGFLYKTRFWTGFSSKHGVLDWISLKTRCFGWVSSKIRVFWLGFL